MNINDFCPINNWEIKKEKDVIVDETTKRNYPYFGKNDVRGISFALVVVTPVIHLVTSVAIMALRLSRVALFYHFWKDETYSFKACCVDAGIDLLKVISQVFAYFLLEFIALYGIAVGYDGQKLYCSLEYFQYGNYLLSSFYEIAPCPTEKDSLDAEKPEKPQPQQEPLPPPQKPPLLPPQPPPQQPPEEKPVIVPVLKLETTVEAMCRAGKMQGIQGQVKDLMVTHILEHFEHLDITKFIQSSLDSVKKKITELRMRPPKDLNEEYINDALLDKVVREALENSNLTPLCNVLKSPHGQDLIDLFKIKLQEKIEFLESEARKLSPKNLEAFKVNLSHILAVIKKIPDAQNDFKALLKKVANAVKDQYIANCKEIHTYKPGKAIDTVEAMMEEEERQDETLSPKLAYNIKLNELLILFQDPEVIEETKKALLPFKLDLEFFKIMAENKEFDPIYIKVAKAVFDTEPKTKIEKLSIDRFNALCLTTLTTLDMMHNAKPIGTDTNLLLSRYVTYLRLLYEDSAVKIIGELEKKVILVTDQAQRAEATRFESMVKKMSTVLSSEIKYEFKMDISGDEALATQLQAEENRGRAGGRRAPPLYRYLQ